MISLLPWRPDPDKIFSDELDAFFNHAVINFDIQPLELYKSRIITSYMHSKNLRTIDTTSGKPVPSEQVKTILTHLFSPDSRARYKSIPTGMPELQVSNVFSSHKNITDFPHKLASLASAYYLLPNIPGFTYIDNIRPDRADQRKGTTFSLPPELKEPVDQWVTFLTECLEFKKSYVYLPPLAFARLYVFNSNEDISDDFLGQMIKLIVDIKEKGLFPFSGCGGDKIIRRKRSTRFRTRNRRRNRSRNRKR